MLDEEIRKTYAQNLWQLSNIITGFSVAEILIVLLSLAQIRALRVAVNEHQPFATGATVVGQAIFVVVVRWCKSRQLVLLGGPTISKDVADTIKIISRIQVALLILVGAGFLVGVWNIL